jgi:hypothetical protein
MDGECKKQQQDTTRVSYLSTKIVPSATNQKLNIHRCNNATVNGKAKPPLVTSRMIRHNNFNTTFGL